MSNVLRLHGLIMDDHFDDLTLVKYVKSLSHSSKCPHHTAEDKFNKGDRLIGEVHIDFAQKDFLIYACATCGAMYPIEGVAPTLYVKKGR